MKIPPLLALILLLSAASVNAASIRYTIDAIGIDSNNSTYKASASVSEECDNNCQFNMPSFNIPEGTTIDSYDLNYKSSEYKVYFVSTKSKVTTKADDSIIVEVTQTEPTLTCSQKQCDKGCVRCEDYVCHDPGFVCKESMEILKLFPKSIIAGNYIQINTQIKNTGNVNFKNIYIELSGEGITTVDKTPIQFLSPGNLDYAFTIINAEKSGTIDVVVKVYVNDVLKNKFLDQIIVSSPAGKQESREYNVTELTSLISSLKQEYNELEMEYQTKKNKKYPVEFIYDKLKETYSQLTEAQANLLDGDYKKANTAIFIIQTSLSDIQFQLDNVQKEKESFFEVFRQNLLYLGSLAGALVAIFAAYNLIKNNVEKHKLHEIPKKLLKLKETKIKKKNK